MSKRPCSPAYSDEKYKTLFEDTNPKDFVCLSEDEIKILAKRIKALRMGRNHTLKDMSSFLNITPQAYNNIELGKRKRNLAQQIIILADVLKTTPEYLVGRTDTGSPGKNTLYNPIFFDPDPGILLHKLYGRDKVAYESLVKGLSLKGQQYKAFRAIIIAAFNYAELCPETQKKCVFGQSNPNTINQMKKMKNL